MRRIMLAAGVAALLATTSLAQDAAPAAEAGALRAEALLGAPVEPAAGGETLGAIADLLIGRDGAVEAVLIDVAGAAGVDARRVALGFATLRFTQDADGAVTVTAEATPEALAARADWRGSPAEALADAARDGATAADRTIPETESAAERAVARLRAAAKDAAGGMGDAGETAERVFERAARRAEAALTPPPAGWVQADAAGLRAAETRGAPLYGPGEERLGKIAALLPGSDGRPEKAVIDLAAAADADAARVEAPLSALRFLRSLEGAAVRAETSATRDALKALPPFEE